MHFTTVYGVDASPAMIARPRAQRRSAQARARAQPGACCSTSRIPSRRATSTSCARRRARRAARAALRAAGERTVRREEAL